MFQKCLQNYLDIETLAISFFLSPLLQLFLFCCTHFFKCCKREWTMQGIRNNLSVNNFDLCAPPYIIYVCLLVLFMWVSLCSLSLSGTGTLRSLCLAWATSLVSTVLWFIWAHETLRWLSLICPFSARETDKIMQVYGHTNTQLHKAQISLFNFMPSVVDRVPRNNKPLSS